MNPKKRRGAILATVLDRRCTVGGSHDCRCRSLEEPPHLQGPGDRFGDRKHSGCDQILRARFGESPATDAIAISLSIRGKDHRKSIFLDCPAHKVSPGGELLDPWGTAYKFYGSGDEIVIRSAGPNRRLALRLG